MPKKGFTFGNPRLYALRRYYHGWIERTLMTVHAMLPNPHDKLTVMQFRDVIDPIKVEDNGRLPCSRYQKDGKSCFREDKTACLFVAIRNLIQKWWECGGEHPNAVEPLLVELDQAIEDWDDEAVIGSLKTGYQLGRITI